MKNNLSEKVLYWVTIFLIITAFFLSLIFSPKKGVLIFLFIFLLIYWQRKRLQKYFQRIKNPDAAGAVFLLIGWIGAIFLEFSLGLSPFHPSPITNYLVGVGFYLPYFIIWLILIKRYQFTIFEIFYLSGLGKLIFDLLITRKLLVSAALATPAISAFLIFFIQTVVTLVLFGMLTTLPVLCLITQKDKDNDKPLKEYLIGLTPGFLATVVFILWVIILKIIFT